MPSNRDRAVAAAIELLGTEGIRALTHLRIDERAGLPKGSTSNHFRTRAALFDGVAAAMVSEELPEVAAAFAPDTVEELIDGLVGLFEFLTGPNLTTTAARLALLVEAGHDPELRASLAGGRRVMEQAIVPTFARLGAPDPSLATQALATCFEGLYLHRIARHAEVDARPVIALVVRAGFAR
ncbi:TetR/AcrR family transcriptional regulator [Nocardioides limicola]|uniref:TetR/AcrR family transcriptional regulator n=1 Tax=Nocardioides limicola TaxID=2803368 RepID=UPI00193B7337|nr:TetR family transcriptional regulator C-terminal domain-containing protein [Nocardioides sp. DJM-14]